MVNIKKISKIKKKDLSGERYLESMLMQAYSLGMLSDGELERIQFDCLTLLAKRTERYNSGDSSSIRIEKAQDILASILFTIGVQLKTCLCPDDAVESLQKEPIEELYQKGRERIDSLVRRTKMLHAALMPKLIKTENEFYCSTAVDGIKGFFKLYAPDFAAQEIHITADYPVYNEAEKLAGIEFIKRYLEQIYYENLFCTNFAAEDIHYLLCGYDEHYQSLLFNLYEPVLAAAIGCVLSGADAQRLELTSAAVEYLCRYFFGKERSEIEQIIGTAFLELSQRISLPAVVQMYGKQSLPLLASAILNAAQTGTLDQIFITPRYPENHPKLIVSYGERMDNELYRKALEEFMGCEFVTDRIDVMKEKIHSLADLNDLLLDAELSGDEIADVLKSLNPPEVAALLKKYTPAQETSFIELRDSEKVLCEGLNRFVSALPPREQQQLERVLEFLELT